MHKIMIKIKAKYKVWLEYNKKPIIGKGRYMLLKAIEKKSSLKEAAELLEISNKTAYNYIKKIENRLGSKIVETHKGGEKAGGYTKLNALGKMLIKKFEEAEAKVI